MEAIVVHRDGIDLTVRVTGAGTPLLLVHGWPHTGLLWRGVGGLLADRYRVIAPDLRGVGGSTRAACGYDLHTLADDLDAVLAALDVSGAVTVGIDVGVSVGWMLAARHPNRVRALVVMEGLLGRLPGAEQFLATPPWWFGFHAIDGLAESVVVGHEERYIGWFLDHGTARGGVDPDLRAALVGAYTGVESLRCGFEFYRNGASTEEQLAAALSDPGRRDIPTLAIAGGVVGEALHHQLRGFTTDLSTHDAGHCGHLIPLDDPEGLAATIDGFAHDLHIRETDCGPRRP